MKTTLLAFALLFSANSFAKSYTCTGGGKTLIVKKEAKASAFVLHVQGDAVAELNGLWISEDDVFYNSTAFNLVDFLGNKAELSITQKVMMGRAGPIGRGPLKGHLEYLGETTSLKCQENGGVF